MDGEEFKHKLYEIEKRRQNIRLMELRLEKARQNCSEAEYLLVSGAEKAGLDIPELRIQFRDEFPEFFKRYR